MKSESKLHQQQEQAQAQQSESVTEFGSAEELLRHDAAQTAVPEHIAERLNESIAGEPKPSKSWWKRFVSGE